ncbi:hypothetical protein PRIPAC_75582 [Pristionchus pacificus]|uniref:Uncharacterized protein n=1 Tax=Pristionchus pacificus TaxID=54126 RepID=A0A2A6C819_PRIPA|nr:hypothetical protein PRIPAC_75582 [Pristionchus pacificus]|eukprot:PDM74250.1 hypothetical protein PRIPAC_41606 [Pristionchus pacificus]
MKVEFEIRVVVSSFRVLSHRSSERNVIYHSRVELKGKVEGEDREKFDGSPVSHQRYLTQSLFFHDNDYLSLKKNDLLIRAVRVKNLSLHFVYSLTGQSDERVRGMKRQILQPDSPTSDTTS